MGKDSIYERLNEMLKNSKGSFSILEEQIDVDLQVEFFEMVNDVSKNIRKAETILSEESILYDQEIPYSEKKHYLVELSNLEEPEAYRIIERFLAKADEELKPWTVLSFQHSRISLETSLLDEEQVFISTGLGGSGERLRYFIAGKLKDSETYTKSQKKIIETEFKHYFKTKDSEIEQISYLNKYFTIKCLIPLKIAISEVVSPVIEEINQYGDFIHQDYLITNIKVLTEKEIEKYFKKKEKRDDE